MIYVWVFCFVELTMMKNLQTEFLGNLGNAIYMVSMKYENVCTDYILFICSGVFHSCKPSDMLAKLARSVAYLCGAQRPWSRGGFMLV